MTLTPVKSYTARYPDKEQVDLNQLLLKHRPNRWKKSGTALLLLSALAASQLTGCGTSSASLQTSTRKMNMAPIFEGSLSELQVEAFVSDLSFKRQKTDIAPLGNFPGGEITSLTEEAALTIIKETLEEHGLSSTASNKKLDVPSANKKSSKWSFDLEISGAKEPVYIEFLLQAHDESKSELSQREALSLPEDSKEAAISLREQLSEVYDNSTGAIFYTSSYLLPPPENVLREQVTEFVEWLKTMGLI